jgi:ADP-heptose:LPS heptosyltransferase
MDAFFVRLALLAINPRKEQNTALGDIREILCVKLWGMGNLTIIYPLIGQLKSRFPDARITFVTFDLNRGFLEGHAGLYRVVYFKFTVNIFKILTQAVSLIRESRSRKVDLVINFETFNNASAVFTYLTKAPVRVGLNNKYEGLFYTHFVNRDPQAHISEVFSDLLRALGMTFRYAYYTFPVKDQEARLVQKHIKDQGRARVCFHPGTSGNFAGRRCKEEYFSRLTNFMIKTYGVSVYFTGSKKENAMIVRILERVIDKDRAFNLAGRFTIWELVEFLRGCRLFVSSDTGPAHLASSLHLNTVVMFGPNSPDRYRPLNTNSLVLYKGVGCSPCMGAEFLTRKCRDQYKCLDFDPEETFAQISKRFGEEL